MPTLEAFWNPSKWRGVVDRAELERLDDEGIAWDRHDADAFVNLMADDFVLQDWTVPEPIRDNLGTMSG